MAKKAFLLIEEDMILQVLSGNSNLHVKMIPLTSNGLKYLTGFQRRIVFN